MKLPIPRPGLVLRYGFLWSHEAASGQEEASKDRPCVIIVAVQNDADGDTRVILAPITHSRPENPSKSLEIPKNVCQSLGLDSDQQWIRFDELNRFTWPGFDLRPIPNRKDNSYGMLPKDLFETLKQKILTIAKPSDSLISRD